MLKNLRKSPQPNQKPGGSSTGEVMEPLFSFWGRWEKEKSQILLGASAIIVVLVLIIAVLLVAVVKLNDQVAHLAENRIMYGFPRDDGVFVSVQDRPPEIVQQFAQRCVSNLYNYDPNTVDRNFARLLKCYDYRQAQRIEERLGQMAQAARDDGLSQLFVFGDGRLTEAEGYYTYTVEGNLYAFADSIEIERKRLRVRLRLNKVAPTEGRASGVSLVSVSEETI